MFCDLLQWNYIFYWQNNSYLPSLGLIICMYRPVSSIGDQKKLSIIKMGEVLLEYSHVKTTSNPKDRGCLVIGNVANLSTVTFDDFAEKLQPNVDSKVQV